jgi:glycosyltransferase involved in cell wall biosynthesis
MHVSNVVPRVFLWTDSDRFAGTERHCLELAGGLRSLGVPVHLGCRPDSPLFHKAVDAQIRVVGMDASGAALGTLSRMSRMLRDGEIDLVHTHNGRCAALARVARLRAGRGTLVATQHFIAPARTNRSGLVAGLSRRIHGWIDRGISRWISISSAVGDAMISRGDTAAGKLRLVHNGVGYGGAVELDRMAARSVLGLPSDVPILVCAARLEREKGHSVLLNAISMLSREGVDFIVVIAGEGAEEGRIRERISTLGISGWAHMVGHQPELAVWLQAADLLVLPSPAEPFGLVVLEAMCRGVPVVAADAGGPREILEDGSGVLFVPGDARDLGWKLLELLRSPERRRRLSRAGRARWEARFNLDRMARATFQVYREAISDRV